MGMDDLTARVSLLAMQGTPIEEIARQLSISEAEVTAALERAAEFRRSLVAPDPPSGFFDVTPPFASEPARQSNPQRFESTVVGVLPADGTATLGGVDLPAGRRRFADAGEDAAIWITDAPVGNTGSTWLALTSAFADTGLWPIVATGLVDGSERPWDSGEFEPQRVELIDAGRALDFLRSGWAFVSEEDDDFVMDVVEPFGRKFPGLTPAPLLFDPANVDQVASGFAPRRLALIAVERPADVVTRLGWRGTVNVTTDLPGVSSVLRSWEDRFGAVLAAMSFDSLVLAVQGAPTTVDEALPIAAEHYAFAPDEIEQGVGSIRLHAEEIIGAIAWQFWWD
jgi:hypothetical protein